MLWSETIAAQGRLLGRFPESLSLLRTCVGQLAALGAAAPATPTSLPGAHSRGQKLRELFGFLHPRALFGNWKSARRGVRRVLFVPLFDRGYCLDTCGLVASALREKDPQAEVLVVTPKVMVRDENLVPSQAIWHGTAAISSRFPKLSIFLRVIPAWVSFVRGVRADDGQRALMREAFGRRRWALVFLFRFLVHYRYVASAATWLRRERISSLVTVNDTAGPGAWLFGAARLLRKDSFLIMHGISGPQNWPFIADECWVWGERSSGALQAFGAPRSRLAVVGHLEIELLEPRAKPAAGPGAGAERTLLILSQICSVAGWKTNVFAEIFEVACAAVLELGDGWKIRIRRHPSDREHMVDEIRTICSASGVEYTFSDDSASLEDDIADSDFAFTVNSTAILSALLQDLPCALYFPPGSRERFGEPFLSDELVVTSVPDLVACLRKSGSGLATALEENREAIFFNRGESPAIAADRILAGPANRESN